jgi:outer membrane protein TolC
MKHNILAPLLLLTLFTPSVLFSSSLSLQQAQELAVEASTAVASSELDLKAAQRTSKINSSLPSISLSAGLNASAGLISRSQISVGANLGAGVSLKLFDGDEYTASQRLLNVDSARLTVESQSKDVRSQVVSLYWDVVAQQLNIESLESTYESTSKMHQANLQKYEAGLIDSLTLSQSELSLYNAEQNLYEAHLSCQAAKVDLQAIIGVVDLGDLDNLLQIQQVKDISAFTSIILDGDKVKQSLLSFDKASLSYENARYSSVIPTLSISASMGLSTAYSSTSNTFSLSDSYSGSVSLSIPTDSWFKNSTTSVNLDNLEIAIEQATINVQQTKKDSIDEIQAIYDEIDRCIRNQETLSRKQALLQAQLKLIQEAYEGGLIDYLSLLEANDNVFQGSLSLLQNQLDYTIYVSTLATSLGVATSDLIK